MPLYVYKCAACGHEFEEIVAYSKRDDSRACPQCKEEESARQVVQPFGVKTTLDPKRDTIYSPKEIDKVVGAKAEEKWAGYNEKWKGMYERRQGARWKGKQVKSLDLPKDTDGAARPIMELGKKESKELRKEFTDALKEHRAERESKGLDQFDAPGAIIED